MVVAKVILADHGKLELSDKSEADDDDDDDPKEESDAEAKKEVPEVEAENAVVRHSAKCAILAKKGGVCNVWAGYGVMLTR